MPTIVPVAVSRVPSNIRAIPKSVSFGRNGSPGRTGHQQDVGRLDVPVDDAKRMNVGQGVGHAGSDDCQFVQGEGTVPDPGPEVLAVHQLHGQEGPGLVLNPAVNPGVEEGHQARVVQRCQEFESRPPDA